MLDTIVRWMNGIPDTLARQAIRIPMRAIGSRMSSQSVSSAGLAIKTGGSAIVKTGAAAWYGVASGVLVTKAAATDMPALVGTVANSTFNVFAFFCDRAGTLTSAMGAAASTLAGVTFPSVGEGSAMLGFIIVNPTGTGSFVGGTTALDDATVVPNVVYVNTQGAFDPTILVS